MKLGFTGTQKGCTPSQLETLRGLLGELPPDSEVHHGDCVGADAQANALARETGLKTVSHPPTDEKKRAHVETTETRPPHPYLERNNHIVAETERLIAIPSSPKERKRSGTWYTVREARRARRHITTVLPDGSTKEERS